MTTESNEKSSDGTQHSDEDFEAFEEKLDELNAGLREAYTAGYKKAMRDFDVETDVDPDDFDGSEYIAENHYYYWDGKTKPLEFWLRELFLDDEQVVTDGGRNVVYRVTDKVGSTLPNGEYDDRDEALDRRAREMASHPDGDLVTVEKVEYLNSVGGDDD